MNRDLIAQLKEVKNHSNTGWVNNVAQNDSRDKLMKAIGHHEDRIVEDVKGEFILWNLVQTTVKPVGVMVLMLAFVFGGWFTSAKAAANSVPGDTLYGLKIVTEQAQLLVTSNDNRAVLHTQFAQRRLSEVQALQAMDTESADQYLIETVHALETEVVKAGDALAQMKLSGDEDTLMVASVLDEKIGAINAELDGVSGQDVVVDAAQQVANNVANNAVDTIVDAHEVDESQESEVALDRSFKNEYTDLRSRQTFDLGRLSTIRLVIAENTLEGIATEDELLHIEFTINKATADVATAMNYAAAGGYRAAFDILREADTTLLDIEAQLAGIESAIMTAMSTDDQSQEVIEEDVEEVSSTDVDQEVEDEVLPLPKGEVEGVASDPIIYESQTQ